MQPIQGKKDEGQPSNYFYGVDVTNRKAVEKEYARLKRRHRIITIVALAVIAFLGLIVFDFVKVTYLGTKPLFSIRKKVENGTLYKGIGYNVLYCKSGDRYVGYVLYDSCLEFDEKTFIDSVYEKLVKYGDDKNIIKRDSYESLKITNAIFDEELEDGGWDYFVEADLTCKGNNRCFYFKKEFNDPSKIYFYIRYDQYNDITDVFTFKSTGAHVAEMKENYTPKIKEYFKENGIIEDEENIRDFRIEFSKNYGKYKFRGTSYAEAYLVEINYLCQDNSNTCVKPLDDVDLDGDYSNHMFMMSMFIDGEDNVALMGPMKYFDL
jgi:hypothetical protein